MNINISWENSPRGLRLIVDQIDVIVLLTAFVSLSVYSLQYDSGVRQFSMLFLVAGSVFLVFELIIESVNHRYAIIVKKYTSGLASDIQGDFQEQSDDELTDDNQEPEFKVSNLIIILGSVALIPLMGYFINHLMGVVLFIIISMLALSDKPISLKAIRDVIIALLVLVPFVYYVFGNIMSVPVTG